MSRSQKISFSSTTAGWNSMELTSKCEALSGGKVADKVKITLALQNVRDNFAQSLNIRVIDSSMWSQAQSLRVNYFNSAAPVDTKRDYQFTNVDKKRRPTLLRKDGKGKVICQARGNTSLQAHQCWSNQSAAHQQKQSQQGFSQNQSQNCNFNCLRSQTSGMVPRKSSGYSNRNSRKPSKKRSSRLALQVNHEVYDSVPLRLLFREDQAKVIKSKWVIGGHFTQIIDRRQIMLTHLKQIILMMSQLQKWGLAVSDVASAFLNTPVDESKGFIFIKNSKRDSISGTDGLETQASALWSWGLRISLQFQLIQVLKECFFSQMKPDPCAFAGSDSSGNVNLIVMAYLDVLAISGESSSAPKLYQLIQKVSSLKDIDYLAPDEAKVRSDHRGVFSKFIDNLLCCLRSTPESPQMVSRFRRFQKIKSSVVRRLILCIALQWANCFRSFQFRDDIKHSVKELSRSLSNPQETDTENLKHLLKYVNQTRYFIFVIDHQPQVPAPDSQRLTCVQIVSYSQSGRSRCQRTRCSTSGSLITVFLANIGLTGRNQANVSQTSAKQNCMLWFKDELSHWWRSSISCRNLGQGFFQGMCRSLSR